MKYFILSTLLCLLAVPALARQYTIDPAQSVIAFAGTHAGNPFEGKFNEWTAVIDFDDANLSKSTAIITLNTNSAKTGNAMYDGTLPTKDWFNADTYPTIVFSANTFEKTDTGYKATGDLTVKDITKKATFDFTMAGTDTKIVTAAFTINRQDYNIGMGSDATGEWVGLDVDVTVKIVAK